jgi:hypothetical protein
VTAATAPTAAAAIACQVRGKSGSWVTVFTFEEAFEHNMRFTWMVAGGMPVRTSQNTTMRSYIRGFEPRAVMPHHATVRRIATTIDEVQRAKQREKRRDLVRMYKGKACLGGQLDLWTDRNSGICYVALHDTYVEETPTGIYLLDELLDFYMFPFTAHTSENIKTWLVGWMVVEELPAKVWVGLTPDGAADGVKAIKMIPGLENKMNVCNLHSLQRSVLYSIGMAGSGRTRVNADARDLIAVNGNFTKLQNQSREVNDGVRDAQIKVRRRPVHVCASCRSRCRRCCTTPVSIYCCP